MTFHSIFRMLSIFRRAIGTPLYKYHSLYWVTSSSDSHSSMSPPVSQHRRDTSSNSTQAQHSGGGTSIWQPHEYPQIYDNRYHIPPQPVMSSPERPGSSSLYTAVDPSDAVEGDHDANDFRSLFNSTGMEEVSPFDRLPIQNHNYPPLIYVDTAIPPYNTNQYHFPPWDASPVSTDPPRSSGYDNAPLASGRPAFQFSVMQSPVYSSASSGNQLSPQLPPSPLISPSSPRESYPPPPSTYSQIIMPTAKKSAATQAQLFREMPGKAVSAGFYGPFVPQKMYKPPTNSDRLRYVEQVELEKPIIFTVENPHEDGIPLADALKSCVKRLAQRDETVFEGRGPSISIRLVWPCYRPWSRQIPTRDFKDPPGPITRAKLAKNIAKNVERFINEKQKLPMEEESDTRWKVGPHGIKLEDLVLVSLHHVSRGSWQPHLRLRRHLS